MSCTVPAKSLLVIEDDLSLIQLIDAMLTEVSPGLEWEYVTSGEDALALISRRGRDAAGDPYRLVISDVFLEGDTTGFDVWRECRRLHPNMPFVVTSGLSVERYRAAWKDASCRPKFLPKPLTMDRYHSVIGEYLNQRGVS